MVPYRGIAWICVILALGLSAEMGGAAAAAKAVGVVDFYSPTPYGTFGISPERVAADELSRLLARASGGRFTVVPRAAVQQAEAAMGWRGNDVLNFSRLRALAQAAGADTLVAGWIPLLVVNDFGGVPVADSYANTDLVLQIFDAAQARLIGETRPSAYVTAGIQRDLLTKQALREAAARGVPALLDLLTR